MSIDKQALIAALTSDKAIFENAVKDSSLMGKAELTSQFLEAVVSGRFDLKTEVNSEDPTIVDISPEELKEI